jgi:hypothetical protein
MLVWCNAFIFEIKNSKIYITIISKTSEMNSLWDLKFLNGVIYIWWPRSKYLESIFYILNLKY